MAGHPFFYEVSFCWICGTWSELFLTRFSLSGPERILQGQSGGPAGLRRGPEGEFWCPRQLAGGDETGNGLSGQYGQHRVHRVCQQGQPCAAYLSETQWRLGDGMRESVHQAETNLVRGVWAMSASSVQSDSNSRTCLHRWIWQSAVLSTRGKDVCGRSPGASITLKPQRKAGRASMKCFRWVCVSRIICCIHTHTYTRSAHKVNIVFWFFSPSFHPSPTCARTEASVRWLKSAQASPRSRPTPFAASATAKTPGICWAWSPVQHGESKVSGQVKKVALLTFTFGVFVAYFQGGSEQSLQEAGGPAAPRQMRGPWQRGRLQGCGERSHLTAEEY